jgi:hypothetical protein
MRYRQLSIEKQHWQHALHTIKQVAFPRAGELERERDTLRVNLDQAEQHIASVHSELAAACQQQDRLIAELEGRLVALGTELNQARIQYTNLEAKLARRDQQIEKLEAKLKEAHIHYESSLNALRETSVPAQAGSIRNRWMDRAMMAAGVLILSAALASTTQIQGVRENDREPAGMNKDVKVSMAQYFSNQDTFLAEELETLVGETAQARTADMETVPVSKLALDAGEQDPPVSLQAKSPGPVPGTGHRRAYGKGGPPLPMEETQAAKTTGKLEFDPSVKEQQSDLLALGFNLAQAGADGLKGRRTRLALDEFQLLYLPVTGLQEVQGSEQLASIVKRFADKSREDEKQFKIDSEVVAAIRLGAMRTGVEFSFLMELAAAESNFESATIASESSAAGLYQFTSETWLNAVKAHGDKYGLGLYASQVEYIVNRKGKARPMIRNPAVYQHVLDLRLNPRVSALLAAESVKDNMKQLSFSLERKLGRTELYLTHFLGMEGAISFLKVLDRNPDKIAGEMFPEAAQSNQRIFRPKSGQPSTVTEIYEMFNRKFNTARYMDRNPT